MIILSCVFNSFQYGILQHIVGAGLTSSKIISNDTLLKQVSFSQNLLHPSIINQAITSVYSADLAFNILLLPLNAFPRHCYIGPQSVFNKCVFSVSLSQIVVRLVVFCCSQCSHGHSHIVT